MNNIRRNIVPDGVCVLTFDRPDSSANIFDRATLEELNAHLDELQGARALVLTSAKEAIFVAGADLHSIKTMSHTELEQFIELGQTVFNKLASLSIPTAAAVHGAAVGGGYEVCLACDWRVASTDRRTRLGLPETQLGIIPAWGGSTRLPRLLGVAKALDIILGGKTVTAKHALKLGMVDDVASREYLVPAALKLIGKGKAGRSIARSTAANWALKTILGPKIRARVRKKTRGHYPAIEEALDVVTRGSCAGRIEDSLARERQAIGKLIPLDSTQNLLRLFFLQERAKKLSVPGIPAGERRVPATRAAVVGAGIMGSGIAQWLGARGLRVLLRDINADRVAAGMAGIARLYADAVKHRIFTAHEAREAMERVSPAPAEVPLRHVDIVIEAAAEKMEIKKSIFRRLDEITGEQTILATNTSALSITELAAATRQPSRVVGIHFFNPVHKMQLVEVVTGRDTSPQTANSAVRFVQKIGKLPVLVKDSPGFLVNRILIPCMIEAGALFEAGASVEQIDEAMLDFGMPMGPLRLIDEVGVDIGEDVASTLSTAFPGRMKVPPIFSKMIEAGLLGRKAGKGFYVYRKGSEPTVNGTANALRPTVGSTDEASARSVAAAQRSGLANALVLLMVNEGARCLEEKVVEEPADVDFAMVMGTGWAPFRGGPLRYADAIGTAKVTEDLSRLCETVGPHYAPCALLCEMKGAKFYRE